MAALFRPGTGKGGSQIRETIGARLRRKRMLGPERRPNAMTQGVALSKINIYVESTLFWRASKPTKHFSSVFGGAASSISRNAWTVF